LFHGRFIYAFILRYMKCRSYLLEHEIRLSYMVNWWKQLVGGSAAISNKAK
jgi:hypothetical protein